VEAICSHWVLPPIRRLLTRTGFFFRPSLEGGFPLWGYWLEQDHGKRGLFAHLEQIALTHQGVRQDTGGPDLTTLILKAIEELLEQSREPVVRSTAQQITDALVTVARREDASDEVIGTINNQTVGRVLGRIGFEKSAAHGSRRSWILSRTRLNAVAEKQGVQLSSSAVPKADERVKDVYQKAFELPVD
jgi:hypothetical protein